MLSLSPPTALFLFSFGIYFQSGVDPELQNVLDLNETAINKQTEVVTLKFKADLSSKMQNLPEISKEIDGGTDSKELKSAKKKIITILSNGNSNNQSPILPNYSLRPEYKDKIIAYYDFLNGLQPNETAHGFSYAENHPPRPPSNNTYVFLGSIFFFLIGCIAFLKMHVVGIRRYIRMKFDKDFTVLRWLGFGFLAPLMLVSCSGSTSLPADKYSIELEKEKKTLNEEIKNNDGEISNLKNNTLNGVDFSELVNVVAVEIEKQKISDLGVRYKKSQEEKAKKEESTRSWIAWIFFGCSLASAFTMGFLVLRYRSRNRKTCPRCFEMGQLVDAPGGKEMLQCKSPYCEKSTFRLEKKHLESPKISIPVVGWGASGKTFWLSKVYEVSRESTWGDSQKVLCNMDAYEHPEFKRQIDDMGRTGQSAGATVQPFLDRTTEPLFISVKDNHRLGGISSLFSTDGLALCFDYAGELVDDKKKGYEPTKAMVAKSNGLVYFLDPTQIDKTLLDLANYRNQKSQFTANKVTTDTKTQIHALNNVAAEFKKARGFPISTPLDIPVAVCLPKVDVVLDQGPLKGKYGELFIKEMKAEFIDRSVSLTRINRRSDIVKKFLPILFAHEDMVPLLETKFGSNFCLFPIASKGFDQTQNSACIGVVEPILWLLHMHGLNVVNE